MATTIQKISQMLTDKGIKHRVKGENQAIFAFGMKVYRDANGEDGLTLVVELMEDGEYFKLFAPQVYEAVGQNRSAFLQACMQCQWQTKLVQFEYDEKDGEIRPTIEFPLEDAELTANQLFRCIEGMCLIIDRYHPTFDRALKTGEILMPEVPGGNASPLPASHAALLMLRALQAEGRGEDDPLVQQLRALIEAGAAIPDGAPDSF